MIYEVNRTIRSCLFIVQTLVRIHVIFWPILIIILQFFEYSYKTNCTHSIFRTIEASASRPSITTRSLTRTSTGNLTRSPTRSPTRTRIQIRTYPTPHFKGRFWKRKVHPHHPWSSRRGSQSTVFTMPAIFACT